MLKVFLLPVKRYQWLTTVKINVIVAIQYQYQYSISNNNNITSTQKHKTNRASKYEEICAQEDE